MPLKTPSEINIRWLFDDVWPAMAYAPVHRDRCISQLSKIQQVFHHNNHNGDLLLLDLDAIEGIGLTIGSGLIFSANQDHMVPFDKWTIGYALELNILQDANISQNNYVKYSSQILKHIQNSSGLNTILNFVREAEENCQFPFEPR